MTAFKSALDRIKADDTLKEKTEYYLRKRITNYTFGKTHLLIKKIIPITCAAVLLCGALIGTYLYVETPTSYLSLDINPSVELAVNTFGKVVSVTSYNDDGKTILAGQKVVYSGVTQAVNILVQSAVQKGFISQDGSTVIALTSETNNLNTAAKLQKEAEQGARTAIHSAGNAAVIRKANVALKTRNQAKELGISPGKLALIQKLQALDPSITVDQYKNATVTEITRKLFELKRSQYLKSFKSKVSSQANRRRK
jgi:uncharacterized protein YchJ